MEEDQQSGHADPLPGKNHKNQLVTWILLQLGACKSLKNIIMHDCDDLKSNLFSEIFIFFGFNNSFQSI